MATQRVSGRKKGARMCCTSRTCYSTNAKAEGGVGVGMYLLLNQCQYFPTHPCLMVMILNYHDSKILPLLRPTLIQCKYYSAEHNIFEMLATDYV